MNDGIEKFLEAITIFPYKSIDIRILAFKKDSRWFSLATKITLEVKAPNKLRTATHLPTLNDFEVIHLLQPYSRLSRILKEISEGKFLIDGREIAYVHNFNGKDVTGTPFLSYNSYERGRTNLSYNKDFSFKFLHSSGPTIRNIVVDPDKLDNCLRSLEYPYNGLADLAENFLFIDNPLDGNNSTYLGIVAPSYMRFGETSQIEKQKLHLEIELFGEIEPKLLMVGIIEHLENGTLKRYSIDSKSFILKIKEGKALIQHKIDGGSVIDAFLSYKGCTVDFIRVYNLAQILSRPLAKMYNHLDPNLNVLKANLAGTGKNSGDDFEMAIAILLGLGGFLTFPFGGISQMRDGVDGIALIPQTRNGIIYECTIGLPDIKNKLSKLSKRTKELKGLLDEFTLNPVIFTALKAEVIPDFEVEKAETERISMATFENIEEALNMFLERKGTKEIFNYLTRLVPTKGRYKYLIGRNKVW
ncbi:MAG: hypothetical protein ACM3YF_07495 [Candidatus Zixiibacteriota bacterium]